ncbi:hypothetical protein ACUOFC_52995, partial [Escherichia sp. TWPC-MK]
RRYPDLTLHRAIKYLLAKEQGHQGNTTETGGYHYSMEEMLQLGQHCSMAERRADEATRDVADWLKCDFMLDQVGNVFLRRFRLRFFLTAEGAVWLKVYLF